MCKSATILMLARIAAAAFVGAAAYAAAGAVVALGVRRQSLADDPDYPPNLHALLSIMLCWPHDMQTLLRPGEGATG
ncbi:MAG TPA: hypothetical protein VMV93_11040 [Chloroflexota bacterium]|nr:hypothetical protein [Chloroflexota bacterium]